MSQADQNLQKLRDINQQLICHDASQTLPTITLSDGTKIQTGTVGTLMQNIKLYDRICAGKVIEGLFDVFPADEWTSGASAGRRFVGMSAKAMGY